MGRFHCCLNPPCKWCLLERKYPAMTDPNECQHRFLYAGMPCVDCNQWPETIIAALRAENEQLKAKLDVWQGHDKVQQQFLASASARAERAERIADAMASNAESVMSYCLTYHGAALDAGGK